eukprot:12458375-Alexandrium_andersonii.AAC.1
MSLRAEYALHLLSLFCVGPERMCSEDYGDPSVQALRRCLSGIIALEQLPETREQWADTWLKVAEFARANPNEAKIKDFLSKGPLRSS